VSYLLDVNLMLACGWRSHQKHAAARVWLDRQPDFATTPISELGFIRVSMSPGYRASFADAQLALLEITARKQARFVSATFGAAKLPSVSTYADISDAYLVELAKAHGLKLATLDDELCKRSWASGIAENPL
jgi:predicted nucleic acid-binding protein